ncbi:hypothetical protein L2E82_40276 [Cichorium intybus]|uniref:Uncharacterized protein n=1 Tax=Cichorium intybus TaxID=13427 RepID=A0ACB9AM95_CICIN|nr:hypothetical protein L2E82_40276 [Cichorium intybus]
MENKKTSFVAVLSLLLLLLIAFNGASIFSIKIPYPEYVAGDSRNLVSVSSSLSNLMYALEEETPYVISKTYLKLQQKKVAGGGDFTSFNSAGYSMQEVQQHQQHRMSLVKEETPSVISNTHLPLLRKSHSLPLKSEDFPVKTKKLFEVLTFIEPSDRLRLGDFQARVKEFFSKNETSCKH